MCVARELLELFSKFGLPLSTRNDARGGVSSKYGVTRLSRWARVKIDHGLAGHPRGRKQRRTRNTRWLQEMLAEL